MSLVIQLPVKSAASLPVIPDSDLRVLSNIESGAEGHWMFNAGSESLVDLTLKHELVPSTDTSFGFTANSLTLENWTGQYLDSGIRDGTPLTLFGVAKRQLNAFYVGAYTGSDGLAIFTSVNTTLPNLYVSAPGAASSVILADLSSRGIEVGGWFFYALSMGASGRRSQVGDSAGSSGSVGLYKASANNLRVGGRNSGGSLGYPLEFAEWGVFTRELTQDQLSALYLRSKSRMNEVGIEI